MPPTSRQADYGKTAAASEEASNGLPTGARPQTRTVDHPKLASQRRVKFSKPNRVVTTNGPGTPVEGDNPSRTAEGLKADTAVPLLDPETGQVTEGHRLGRSVDRTLPGMGVSTPKHSPDPLVRTPSDPRLTSFIPQKGHIGPSLEAINDHSTPVFPQEYVVDHITDHGFSRNGRLVFGVRWYGFTSEEETYELMEHLPRSKVIQYYKRKRVPQFKTLNKAMTG